MTSFSRCPVVLAFAFYFTAVACSSDEAPPGSASEDASDGGVRDVSPANERDVSPANERDVSPANERDVSTSDREDAAAEVSDVSVEAEASDVSVEAEAATPEASNETGAEAFDVGTDAKEDAPSDAPCGPCPSGLCLDGGVCAECGEDGHCGGATPRCDTASHQCVACLPGAGDNCPTGQYCTNTFTCVRGCRTGTDCASGACDDTNHNCVTCTDDLECNAGLLCGTGTCESMCQGPGSCAGGLDCCTDRCVDVDRDIAHCGSCASACLPTQFCGTTGCAAVSFTNICANRATTAVFDGYSEDDASNLVLQNAFAACPAPPTTATIMPGMSGPLNGSTGRPVVGGNNLLTAAGGFAVHKLVGYLESTGASPIRLTYDNVGWQYRDRTPSSDAGADGGEGTIVASIAYADQSSSHDLLLIELVRDPSSGTLILAVFGTKPESTRAAALFFANVILPNRSSYQQSWYIYDWTGTSDAGPSSTDTFLLRASGP